MRAAGTGSSASHQRCGPGRGPRRRVIAVVLVLALGFGFTGGSVPGAVPPGGPFPLTWLHEAIERLTRPGWLGVDAERGVPSQTDARGHGDGHYAQSAQTRARDGAGGDAGDAPGALPDEASLAETAARAGVRTPSTTAGQGTYDAATSTPLSDGTDRSSTTYRNADGSFTRRLSSGPVNFKDTDGRWKPIDTRLVDRDQRLHIAAHDVDVSVAHAATPSSTRDALATVALPGGQSFGFGLAGAEPVAASVTGSTATYPSVLPHTDLELAASSSELKETIVLHSPEAGNVWDFPLDVEGLTPSLDKGSVVFTDRDGRRLGWIPGGFMSDSRFDQQRGDNVSSGEVSYELVTVDGRTTLRVTASRAWLDDKDRVYPVKVDPTFGFYVQDDVFVDNDDSTAAQRNGVDFTVGTYDDGVHVSRSFIDVSNFDANGMTGRRITGARLKLFLSWTFDCNHVTPVSAYEVAEPWTVDGVANTDGWGPNFYSDAIGSASPVDNTPACTNNNPPCRCVGEWMTIPLSVDTFNRWSRDPSTNHGLALRAAEGGFNSRFGWKRFASRNYADGSLGPVIEFDYNDVAPQINAQYPPNNYATQTLQPELVAEATDPDNWPQTLTRNFLLYDKNLNKIAESGPTSFVSWFVPAGTLTWNEAYFWTVIASDGFGASTSQTMNLLRTMVPQPSASASLSQNGGQGIDTSGGGNYTTSALDVSVPTVGPELAIRRSFNSLDLRPNPAFGFGWSSILDTRVVDPYYPLDGNARSVFVRYPSGQDVGFAKNADGTYSAAAGRFATLTRLTGAGGGYQLVDKDGTTYAFTKAGLSGDWYVTSIRDANARTMTFDYAPCDATCTATTVTSASGRKLYLTWTIQVGGNKPKVATISTDPAVPGDPSTAATWTYGYTGALLTSVCPPGTTTACTRYTYANVPVRPARVLGSGAQSYWRLTESSGTVAASSVIANSGADAATYSNVNLGQPGPISGGAATAAGFNGTNSALALPASLLTSTRYTAVSLWFKTTTAGGVLLGEANQPWNSATAPSHAGTPLYVGTDGRLHGGWYTGNTTTQIVSFGTVTDGNWHHVVLDADGVRQSLYLDGFAEANTMASPLPGVINHLDQSNVTVGAGYSSGAWPAQPPAGWRSFNGTIADVAIWDHPLSWPDVKALRDATSVGITSITRPSGGVDATVQYNPVSGAVTQIVDGDGGTWGVGTPAISGSYRVHQRTVLGASPTDYWRLAENGTTQAINEINGHTATYSSVTLGVPGGPFDDPARSDDDTTVASFNGASSWLALPTEDLPGTGPYSVSAWFKLPPGDSGVLLGYQTGTVLDPDSSGWVPALYVGVDGRLRGQFWNGAGTPVTTADAVNDGAWHHVSLTTTANRQILYLDGAKVGQLDGALQGFGQQYVQIGAGKWSLWPGAGGNVLSFWPGQVAEVSSYQAELSQAQVSAQFAAREKSSGAAVKTVIITDPGNQPVRYVLDAWTGRKVAEIDQLGRATTFGYDTGGFLHTVTDPNGNVVTTEHDVRGNTIAQQSCQKQSTGACSTVFFTFYPDATTRQLTPDARNDVMLTMRDGRSSSATDNTYLTTYAYDASGNRTGVTDALGRVTTTAFTTASTPAFGGGTTPPALPLSVTTPGGAVQTVDYDANGDVARITDPAGKVTTFAYDGRGRVITRTETTTVFPAGLTTSFTYDAANRVLTQTSPAVTNRVTGAVHTPVTTTQYNVDGQETARTVSDATGGDAPRTISWTYNSHGQRATETDPAGKTTTVEFDAYGRLFRQTAPDGVVTESAFDAKGQLLTTTAKNFTGDPNHPESPHDLVLTSRAYDPGGRLASEGDAMGWQTLYAYTDNNLLAEVRRKDPATGVTFLQRQDTFDAAGNVVSRRTNDGRTTTNFAVDQANRTYQSTVDPTGVNRSTTQTLSPDNFVTATQVRDGANQLVAGTETTYDPLGRVTSSTVLSDGTGTAGWWKLDETAGRAAADASGNNRTATASTSTVTWGEGGAAVNGTGLFATAGPVLNTAQSYTVSAWVKLRSTGQYLTAVGQGGANNGAFFLQYAPGIGYRLVSPSSDSTNPAALASASDTNPSPPLNTWTHVVGTVDTASGAMRLYVNGVPVGAGTNPTPWHGAGQFTIGGIKYGSTAGDLFDGSVDNVQVFARALSASEAATLYGLGRGGGSLPSRLTTSYVLDSSGLPRSMTDANGNTTDYGLDEAGRVAVVSMPAVPTEIGGAAPILTRPVTYAGYDTFGGQTESKDPDGNVTVVAYDAAGRAVATTSPTYTAPGTSTPLVASSTRTYDNAGMLSTQTDPLGNQTHYAYDQLGRLATVTAPDGGVSTFTYDLIGDQLSSTDPTGAKKTAVYDFLGRTTSSTEVVRQAGTSYTTTYSYGPGGWLSATHSPAGVTTSTVYNDVGEPVSTTDAAGKVTSLDYDAVGRRTRVTMPDATYTTTTYDLAGRPVATGAFDATNTQLAARSAAFDAVGNPTAATDGRGTTSTFIYDAAGRPTAQVQPVSDSDAITTSFGYDPAGNQTRFTDGRGNAFLSTYNAWGRLESRIEPATAVYAAPADRTFTSSYDLAGRLAARTEPGGISVGYTYDQVGRLTAQTGTGAEVATAARAFGYDPAGRVTSFNTPGADATLTYDDRGLLLSTAGGAGSSTFTYDADGRMASRADAAGSTTYTYDTAGRLSTVVNPSASVAATYAYNDLSQVNRVTYGSSGDVRMLGYDTRHRLTSDELKTPGGTSVAKITYGWDGNDNETSKTTTGFAGATTNTYTYDLANRLKSWDNGTTPTLYAYDRSGNRTQAGTNVFTYDERNQLKTGAGSVVYSYTPRGTLASASTLGVSTVYTRSDAFGQVRTQFTASGAQHDYAYDAVGRLVRAGTSYTGMGNTLAGDVAATYTRDPDGALVGTAAGTTKRLVWTDRHSDVVAQFDATAATLGASAAYDPLGLVVATTSMLGSLGYQSEYTDSDTGRVNMLTRWYNTATGSFDTRDTIDVGATPNPVQANRFAYADDNPLTNADPTGHCAWYDLVCGVAKAAATVSSAASTAWHATTTALTAVASLAVDAYHAAKDWAVNTFNQAMNWAADKASQARDYVVEKAAEVRQSAEQTLQLIKQAAKNVITDAARVVVNTVNTVKDAYQKTEQWVVEHKDMLIEAAAVVGSIAAGIACTAVTAGVGAVACMVGAAALINVAKDFGQGNLQNIGDIFQSAGIGAVQGLFGAVGGIAGGKIVTSLASRLGTRLLARVGAGAIGGAITDGVTGAGLDAATQLISTGRIDARQALNAGLSSAAIGAATGGVFGGFTRPRLSCANSFAAGTRVTMADGSTRPIEDITVGDQVKATDPASGTTSAKPVTMLHLNRDRKLTDLQVAARPAAPAAGPARPFMGPVRRTVLAAAAVTAIAAGVSVATISTTQEHPFWDATTGTWTVAAELKPGASTLATPDGTTVEVVAVDTYDGARDMYNLTVADIHTYYVEAGDTPVLVHNCGTGGPNVAGHPETCSCAGPVEVGQTVFRVAGRTEAGGARPWGQFWSRVDPRTVPDYRDAAGLPLQNPGRFLLIGRLRGAGGIEVTPGGAVPLGGTAGGIDEIRVPYPSLQIRLSEILGLNPEM